MTAVAREQPFEVHVESKKAQSGHLTEIIMFALRKCWLNGSYANKAAV